MFYYNVIVVILICFNEVEGDLFDGYVVFWVCLINIELDSLVGKVIFDGNC